MRAQGPQLQASYSPQRETRAGREGSQRREEGFRKGFRKNKMFLRLLVFRGPLPPGLA